MKSQIPNQAVRLFKISIFFAWKCQSQRVLKGRGDHNVKDSFFGGGGVGGRGGSHGSKGKLMEDKSSPTEYKRGTTYLFGSPGREINFFF